MLQTYKNINFKLFYDKNIDKIKIYILKSYKIYETIKFKVANTSNYVIVIHVKSEFNLWLAIKRLRNITTPIYHNK